MFKPCTHVGLNPDGKQLKEMLKEAPGQLNFTHFLTLFGEKMHGKTASAPAQSPRGRWRYNSTRKPVTSYRGRVSYPGVKPASASGSWFFLPNVDFVDSLWSACAAVTLATCVTLFSDLVYTFFQVTTSVFSRSTRSSHLTYSFILFPLRLSGQKQRLIVCCYTTVYSLFPWLP